MSTVIDDDPFDGEGYLGILDRLVDEISAIDTSQMRLEELEALVLRVNMVVHQTQKKITKNVSKVMEDARDKHLESTLNTYRGRTVMLMAVATGSLHVFAAASYLNPGGMVSGGDLLNKGVSKVSGGRISALVDMSQFAGRNMGEVGRVFHDSFSGIASASGNVQSLATDRRQSLLTEHNSKSERYKLDKQETDQEVNQQGGRVDEAKRMRETLERSRHETFIGMLR